MESILNGGMNVVADGSYLKDIDGKVIGTLNEDGSYSLLSAPFPPQVSESHESLLQSFESQMASESTSYADFSPKYQMMDTDISYQVQPAKPVKSTTSLLKPVIHETIANSEIVKPVASTSKMMGSHIKKEINIPEPMPSVRPTQTVQLKAKYEPITISTPVTKKEPISSQPITQSKPAPLGSSGNPIRIIQQGNSYTSTQELTKDQLAQIMQVVQQQQALKEAQEAGGQKVIYNPQTQTKIVYKVVNPVPETKSNLVSSLLVPKPGRKRGRAKQGSDDDEYRADGPELSRKEKEEKKKKRPRTRSGRVSKPPKHMIDDYKHIHLVDWREDYDDSDGGYSDYKGETDEEEKQRKKMRLEDESLEQQMQGKSMTSAKKRGEMKEGIKPNQQKTESTGSTENGDEKPTQQKKTPWNRNSKRYKLKELMSRCPDEVLLDVMLPKLCNMVSVWEFLLMKIEDEHPDTDVTFPMIYREYETLRVKVKQAFDENIKEGLLERVDGGAAGDASSTSSKFSLFSIKRDDSARSLGAEMGIYRVVDRGPHKPDYMFLTSKMTPQTQAENNKTPNRQVALVKEDQVKMPSTGNKKPEAQSLKSEPKQKTPTLQPENDTFKSEQKIQININATPLIKPEIKTLGAKSDNKIEVLSVPKEKLQRGADNKFRSFGEIKRELEQKRAEERLSAAKIEIVPEIKKTVSNGSVNTQLSNVEDSNATKLSGVDGDGKVLEIPNSKQLTASRVSKPKDSLKSDLEAPKSVKLPVPSRGSVVLTSSSDLEKKPEVDETKIAKALATSVVNRKAENATGVVSDMSDLDVWESPSEKKALTTTSLTTSSSSAAPSPATTAPSSKPSHKMVSIVGIRPEDKTVQFAAETNDNKAEAVSATPDAVPSEAQPVDAQGQKIQTIVSESGEEMQIPEGVQMVIQHPDGSYQLIENPDEAAELMRQAELAEKEGEGQASQKEIPQGSMPDTAAVQSDEAAPFVTEQSSAVNPVETQPGNELTGIYSQASEMSHDTSEISQSQTSNATIQSDAMPEMFANGDEATDQVQSQLQQPFEQPVSTSQQLLEQAGTAGVQMSNQAVSETQQILEQPSEEGSNQSIPSFENMHDEGAAAGGEGAVDMLAVASQSLQPQDAQISPGFDGSEMQMPDAPTDVNQHVADGQNLQTVAEGVQDLAGEQMQQVLDQGNQMQQVLDQGNQMQQVLDQGNQMQQVLDQGNQVQQQQPAEPEMAIQYATSGTDSDQIQGIQSIDTSVPVTSYAQPAAPEQTQETVAQPDAAGQAIDPNAQTLIFQTDDGLILIRQPDGNFQVQSTTGAEINMETVQALINSLQLM